MNYYIPKYSMVQLPVIPLETALIDLTSGTYLDEFAESHVKDMEVRGRLSGMVPSAGVGTGFSRDSIEELSLKYNGQIFNTRTFTEDYDLAFRLNAIGKKSVLLQFFIEKKKKILYGWKNKKERIKTFYELVGTREYFPSNFGAAVRQKSRWTLGIVFHGWKERGWEGNLALRYMVWRDRKTLLTHSVNMLGYCLLILSLCLPHTGWAGVHAAYLQPISPESWIWKVIFADAILSLNRCVQRVIILARISSWKQALLSLPRIIWGNIINFCAVMKATHLFIRTAVMGKKLVWAKTAHAFPTEEQISNC